MDIPTETMRNQLRIARLRVTPARVAVLTYLAQQAKPLAVQDVLRGLGAQAPDQATVYRVLTSLVHAELVREVLLEPGAVRYEVAHLPHHHHVTCVHCGLVEDVTTCSVGLLPTPQSFHAVIEHQLEFRGVCAACAPAG